MAGGTNPMKRLIFWTLTLFLLTTSLTGGIVAYARTHGGENPLKAMGFEVCDGNPCFMGIVIGETTWDDIHKLIGINRNDLPFPSVNFNSLVITFRHVVDGSE